MATPDNKALPNDESVIRTAIFLAPLAMSIYGVIAKGSSLGVLAAGELFPNNFEPQTIVEVMGQILRYSRDVVALGALKTIFEHGEYARQILEAGAAGSITLGVMMLLSEKTDNRTNN